MNNKKRRGDTEKGRRGAARPRGLGEKELEGAGSVILSVSPRPSVLVSVVASWIAAWALWGLVGGLAAHYGLLDRYDGTLFAALALAAGAWQYRTQVRQGRERALTVFVAAQILWLVVVMVRNGVLTPP